LALFSLTVCAVMGLIALLFGRLLRLDRRLLASLIIVSVLVNSGNYGLAATKFAFGDAALPRALVCFVASTVVTYTFGVLLASLGKASASEAFRNVLLVPAFYGLIAAAVVRQGDYEPPLFLMRTATLLSDAAIPSMLIVLGLQIAEIRSLARSRIGLILAAGFLQLILTPLVALALVQAVGLSGIARQAAVLQASMPAAVITTVLAVEYDLDQPLITGCVFLTTLLSPLTLTPLIAYLLRTP
jgi:predicted permease